MRCGRKHHSCRRTWRMHTVAATAGSSRGSSIASSLTAVTYAYTQSTVLSHAQCSVHSVRLVILSCSVRVFTVIVSVVLGVLNVTSKYSSVSEWVLQCCVEVWGYLADNTRERHHHSKHPNFPSAHYSRLIFSMLIQEYILGAYILKMVCLLLHKLLLYEIIPQRFDWVSNQ